MTASQIAKELVGLKRRMRILEMAPRLASASLEGAPLPSFDNDGNLRAIIGAQPDGSHTIVVKDGPTPLQPTDPTGVGGAYSIAVTWDGNLIGAFGEVDAELETYADFDACEVHVGLTESYFPERETLVGLIGRQGGTVNVSSPAGEVWVRLRIRSQAGKVGPPSPAVLVSVDELVDPGQFEDALQEINDAAAWIADSGATLDTLLGGPDVIPVAVIDHLWANVIRARKITTDMLLVGSGDNLVVDPYLTDVELSDARAAASTGDWTRAPMGAFEGTSEMIFNVPTGGTRTLRYISSSGTSLERVDAVTPGTAYRIRYDHRRVGTSTTPRVRPAIRWLASDGTAATVYPRSTTVAPGTAWATDEVEWTAPDDAVGAYVEVVVTGGTTSTAVQIRRPRINSKADASLIVDGAVKARHIVAEEIAAALGEFITVKANNIEAGSINVALDLTTGGKVTANGGAGKTELDHSGLYTTDSLGRAIFDTRGGAVTMRGSLKTGATDTNGIHIVPDGSRLGNGLVEFRSSTTPRNAEIALESRTGSLAALMMRGPAPADITDHPATVTLQYATGRSESLYEVEADRIQLYAAAEVLLESIDNTVRLQGREVIVNGDNLVDEWKTYTPLLRATSSNPVPGSTTTREGRYKKIGTTVHFAVEIILGNMTNRGSGSYRITLPVPAVGLRTYCFGNISPDTIAIGAIEPGVDGGFINRIRFVSQTRSNDTNPTVNNTTPADLSSIRLSGTYECAP